METLETDVLIVGAGAAGLYAAAQAAAVGLGVVVVEASELLGGSTAADTGQLWLPGTEHGAKFGGPDRPADIRAHLDAILGAPSAASSAARRDAFAETSAAVGAWLDAHQVGLGVVRGKPDFHPEAPQARRSGRVVAAAPFDKKLLGPLADRLRGSDYALEIMPRSPRGLVAAASALGHRLLNPTKDVVLGGAALSGRLLLEATRLGAKVWPSTQLTGLVSRDGRVTGAEVLREGRPLQVQAHGGVILACGGFEGNADWRREHLPLPTDASWTTGLATNTGAGMRAAVAVGGRLVEMGEAWWTVVARFDDVTYRMTSERSLPHGIIVDRAGDRFFDEAGPAPEAGRALYARNRRVRAIPAYLILDHRHRQRYRLGPWLPGSTPRADADGVVKATSLAELATELKIDQAGLLGTVVRFNGLAAKGRDSDFGRGASIVDRSQGDPTSRRNPCLGTLEKSPYWAVPVYPGDSGTKGGLLTDADARVLDAEGRPLPGLYAVAGTAASLFVGTSPGVGAALVSALVDAHRAVAQLAASDEHADAGQRRNPGGRGGSIGLG